MAVRCGDSKRVSKRVLSVSLRVSLSVCGGGADGQWPSGAVTGGK